MHDLNISQNQELGRRGETLAKQYLLKNDYRFVASNLRCGHLEIDLIFKRQQQFIFVEVKTRIKNADSVNENPLNKWQTANLKRAIIDYCFKNHINFDAVRLDLIIILANQAAGTAELKHYRDVL